MGTFTKRPERVLLAVTTSIFHVHFSGSLVLMSWLAGLMLCSVGPRERERERVS